MRVIKTGAALLFLAVLLTGLDTPPSTAQTPATTFSQLAGEAGCLFQPLSAAEREVFDEYDGGDLRKAGCGSTRAIFSANALTVSPDQRHVYVAASGGTRSGSNAIGVYARAESTGALTFTSCVSDDGGDGRPGTDGACVDGDALLGADDLAFSSDGRDLYVVSSAASGLAWFTRDAATGALQQGGCAKFQPLADRCTPNVRLRAPRAVAVSGDGRHVYVASKDDDAILTFERDAQGGVLSYSSCVSASGSDGSCANVTGLQGVADLALSPDGRSLYAAADFAGGVTVFARDPQSGALSQRQCLLDQAPKPGSCSDSLAIAGPQGIVVSPEGTDVYVVGSDRYSDEGGTIAAFRTGADGLLKASGCVRHRSPQKGDRVEENDEEAVDEEFADEDSGSGEPPDRLADCAAGKALWGPREATISADGRSLFVGGVDSVAAFARDPQTGAIRQTGCVEDDRTYISCSDARATSGASALAATADGRNVYVTASEPGSLAVFAASVSVGARALLQGPVARVTLSCPVARDEGCRASIGRARTGGATAGATLLRLARGTRRTVLITVPARTRRAVQRGAPARLRISVRELGRGTRPFERLVHLRRPASRR